MASFSSGNSSGSPQIQNSGSEGDFQQVIDLRKRKRMESNRESARRSRMRKQKHLDDLLAQAAQLKTENSNILSSINATTKQFVNVETRNSILRTQMMELNQRLHSLNEILNHINSTAAISAASASATATAAWSCMFEAEEFQHMGFADNFFQTSMGLNPQPIIASAEIFDF